jgi:integrase
VLPDGEATWTALGQGLGVVGPAEEFLEFLRVQGSSPNTVKSYARALALWWSYLSLFGLAWDVVTLSDLGGFLAWLRSGDGPQVVPISPREPRFSESTVGVRLKAVTSCYRFHELNGVPLGGDLVRVAHGGRAAYKPMLDHLARKTGRRRSVLRVRSSRGTPPPVLSPHQIMAICDACALPGPVAGQWTGQLRDRLLWLLLAESGLRLGEALGLQHQDWRTGRGDTPFIEVVPRDHPHGVRVKGQRYRRVFISDELDCLYGEYAWQLCEAGADLAVPDLDAAPMFVNLAGGTRFAPWRPDSVYDLVGRLRRDLAGQVPASWSPHWMRHSHATASLAHGIPITEVSRWLGHKSIEVTHQIYGHLVPTSWDRARTVLDDARRAGRHQAPTPETLR